MDATRCPYKPRRIEDRNHTAAAALRAIHPGTPHRELMARVDELAATYGMTRQQFCANYLAIEAQKATEARRAARRQRFADAIEGLLYFMIPGALIVALFVNH